MSFHEAPIRLDAPAPRGRPPRSLYVHAPFCARRCYYCDFAVHVRKDASPEAWLGALDAEWAAVWEEGDFRPEPPLETLYVGGGTPSLLGPSSMSGLAELLGPELLAGADLEWTAEANPESFTPELARAWREAGVSRVSLGVQSFHEGALAWMGRLHGPEGAARAVRVAQDAGFTSLSVDLIFGLPGHLGRSWEEDVERVLDLEVPHVSLYGLGVEPQTPLGRAVTEGREQVADEEAYEAAYLMAANRFLEEGFVHYEVSNFALSGHESRHNGAYWNGSPYLGLGNSAHSYRHPVRRWNLRDWGAYSRAAKEGGIPVEGQERLTPSAARLERIWLGLRTRSGLDRTSLSGPARTVVDQWVKEGWATAAEGAVRLTPRGWLLLDRLTVELDQVYTKGEATDSDPSQALQRGGFGVTRAAGS